MSKKYRNPNRQGFMKHVDTIKGIESDKDTFLKAARLERHESKREPLTAKDIMKVCAIMGGSVIVSTALVLGYLGGCFLPALGMTAFVLLIGGAVMSCS